MNDNISKLLEPLEDAIAILRWHGFDYWAERLSESATYLKKGYLYGIDDLLSAFGGMGSFNDIYICPENARNIQQSEIEQVNRRLQQLQSDIYTLAKQIKSEI